ncbi:hypothetical protein Q7C36_022048 [Tachysurus vachellii]|uniref:Galectin domain-containing protein n=1 Tax=Tachysurus vachellii TaxID=175792 RepID=A0AA88IP39_TACVA|nr:hypothetical protein Q7C36_022048 [Tachysurus vachellii]
MDSRCMEIAALGRPLYPGMLYDCRNDSFIPGVTLWDKKALSDDLDVHQKPKSHLKFAASDSLSDKANLLDISASLKASFLSGLVEVGGSAKYLQDTRSSAHQSRVTMQYSQTTTFEQFTMKELGNITYPQVFDQKTATHVVTAVLYGAQVFMVFDYTSAENENKQEIEGNLRAVVKKIPSLSIEGQASLNMTEDEKNMAENISVTFYGDIKLEENPTTYKDALEVYKKVPDLMKQQGKGVPLTLWLYPLNLLDDKAAKLANKNEKRIKFIIASISDPSNPGSSIQLYQNGSLTPSPFQPVSISVPFTFHWQLTVDQWNFSMPSLITELRTKLMNTTGMSRWSPSTIKSEVTNIVHNPTLLYTEKIPGGLREGKAFYFQGVVFSNSKSFTLDFETNESDIAFHFRPWFNKYICCNSFVNKNWQTEEHVQCNFSKGSAFDIFVVIKTEGYEVYVNGQKSLLFNHRIPMAKVNAVRIHGDVKMNIVGIVANWSQSTFGKELNTGISRTKLSDIQSNVPHPVCNPVMVNGQVSYTFEHRIPVDKVTTLNIDGDVFMNSFAITKVDVKVTVTNPDNI